VNEKCELEIHIGTYRDAVLCDIMSMDVCHVLLGGPWKYDIKYIHDGKRKTYSLEKDGKKHVLLPLKDEAYKEEPGPNILLMSGKKLLQEVKRKEELHFSLIGKPKVILTSTNLDDFPDDIKIMLDEFDDIVVVELPNSFPPETSINHHIDLIPSVGTNHFLEKCGN